MSQLETHGGVADALLAPVRAVGLRSIAAGVESTEQVGWALALGCVDGQGYYFAPPLPAEALLERLAASQ